MPRVAAGSQLNRFAGLTEQDRLKKLPPPDNIRTGRISLAF